MKVLLWRRGDGGFSYTVTTTDDEVAAQAHAKVLAQDANHAGYVLQGICDDGDMPDGGVGVPQRDGTRIKPRPAAAAFKGAWGMQAGKPTLDMAKARDIHMDRIRKARDRALAALDVGTIQAVGKGDVAARDAVEAQKQPLRDLPATIDLTAAKTPEDLAALWPAGLAR